MAQPGFVYILINPALAGCLKIGRTTRNPGARAQELSMATGVPMPFVLAYDLAFSDCDRAEQFVHAYLEGQGFRLSDNREFFTTSLKEAIRALHLAHEALEGSSQSNGRPAPSQFEDEVLNDPSPNDTTASQPVWYAVLEEAQAHHYGLGEVLEDRKRALVLYEQAARLGAPDAYISLAEMTAAGEGCLADQQKALDWLKRGADRGVLECWARMADIFAGNEPLFESINIDNARKCWRRFFASVNPALYERGTRALFYIFYAYVAVLTKHGVSDEDKHVVRQFGQRFISVLTSSPDGDDKERKIASIEGLLQELGVSISQPDAR
jgi:TPR repeat protein